MKEELEDILNRNSFNIESFISKYDYGEKEIITFSYSCV